MQRMERAMLNANQHIPYYVQIKEYLKKLASERKPHESMPSESKLSEMFNVSRGTVKQAVMDLVFEGILYREQGRGTFVAPTKITRSFDRLPSFTDDIRRMGCGPDTRIIKLAYISPTPFLMQLFDMQQDETLVKIKRLVSMENSPIVVLTSYLNPHVYPRLAVEEIGDSLYEALQKKYSLVPVKAHDTYTIVDIAPQTAKLLQCQTTAHVCYSQRIGYLASGLAVEYVESFIRSDRFKIDVRIGMDTALQHPDAQDGTETHYDVGFRSVII